MLLNKVNLLNLLHTSVHTSSDIFTEQKMFDGDRKTDIIHDKNKNNQELSTIVKIDDK